MKPTPARRALEPELAEGVASCEIAHFAGTSVEQRTDHLVVEEPLEIRVAGEVLAVTLRTPGYDREVALGFLLAEGLIRSRNDVGSVAHCGRPGEEGYGNVIDVQPAPGTVIDLEQTAVRRGTLTTSACGVCGRRSIDDLIARCGPVTDDSRWEARVVSALPERLLAQQRNFARTGGLHAAGLSASDGRLICVREDVGRHNAVDKVFGRMLLDDALPAPAHALVVSGRASFEIVQKAVTAGVGLVVSVSAPSSLAVATALGARVTLVGFARGGSFNVYTYPERLGDR
jgi:FdhD protein